MKNSLTILLILSLIVLNCKEEKKMEYEKGTFGYDLQFLTENVDDVVVLENDLASIVIVPKYQGRVMTSTAEGMNGKSFGWLNYDLISSSEIQEHINIFGGEDRFWLGPEGGQFSIYFKSGSEFNSDNWYVPKQIDTEPFDLISKTSEEAKFEKEMALDNYSGTHFNLKVKRTIKLLSKDKMNELLSYKIPADIKIVGYESENTITNTGEKKWTKETGALSIWILSMFAPSDNTVSAFPFINGEEAELGKIVTSDYFGEISDDRLKISDKVVFFKCDGKSRSKIGFSSQRAKPFCGSYNSDSGILTIMNYSLPSGEKDYVNSLWKFQDEPFGGDVLNSYNDGKLEDGTQLGPFYELESSSPAAFLKPNESLTHIHRIFHLVGSTEVLDKISQSILGISIDQFKSAFK